MPFGLTNTPTTFQGVMNKIFAPLLRKHVLVFMDDILVYNPSLEDHLLHLEEVLKIIQEHISFAFSSLNVFLLNPN